MKKVFIALMMPLIVSVSVPAQTMGSFSGKVVDSSGEPLIGAGVVIKGTTNGSATDYDGNYMLTGISFPVTVVVSCIGYDDSEIHLTGKERQPYVITLNDSRNVLDEIVVVGYGTQKKSSLSGAVGIVDGASLEKRPAVSAANALQGADPSLYIKMGNGGPNSSPSINVRGSISVNGGSPLVLADGVEVSLQQINPNDIESVSVLKDASTCAIYGAKASAGVVLITTKQGKTGKSSINYNFRQAWIQPTTNTDYITSGYEHVSIVNMFCNQSFHSSQRRVFDYTAENGRLLKLYERRNDKTENPSRPWVVLEDDGLYHYYGNYDWYHNLLNTNRPTSEHNVSVSGGNDKVKYYVSGRYYTEDGIFKEPAKDTYQNFSVRSKITAKVTDWIKYSNNISYNVRDYKWGGNEDTNLLFQRMWFVCSPAFSPVNPDGSLVVYPSEIVGSQTDLMRSNAAQFLAGKNHFSRNVSNFDMTHRIDMTIAKHLVLTGEYDFRRSDTYNTARTNNYYYGTKPGEQIMVTGTTKSYKEVRSFRNSHVFNAYGTYENDWNGHYFKATAGMQYENYRSNQLSIKAWPILNDAFDSFAQLSRGDDTTYDGPNQSISTFATLGIFGRLNYDWKGRYIVEASARYDGTSRFASGSRWGFFPSASAAWRFSEEPFFSSVRNVITNGKIRFSAGSLGNQQVSNYYYLTKVSSDNTMSYTFDRSSKAAYSSVSAPVSSGLTWETVTTYDLGLDLNFLDNRLSFVGDYFIRDTKDMLTASVELPATYGATSPKENCANLRTKGWEISIDWKDSFKLLGKQATYSVSLGIGDNKTVITKYYNPTGTLSSNYKGKTLGDMWGYRIDGLFQSDEEAAEYMSRIDSHEIQPGPYQALSSSLGTGLKAGDPKFRDLNGDGKITSGAGTLDDPGDREIIGNSRPRFPYSFRLGFNWAGLDISAFFQGISHQDWYPTGAYGGSAFWGPYSYSEVSFIAKDFMGRVYDPETNPDGYFPRPRAFASYSSGNYNLGLGQRNDRYMQNIGYLRFKNLTVGYTLPESLTRKFYVSRLRVFFTGENLYYWSPLKKYCTIIDPELANASSLNTDNTGIGYLYPKTLSFGVDVTF